jgi:hypothetical protein
MQREIFDKYKDEIYGIKDFEYKTSLAILTVLEILVDKEVVTGKELKEKAKLLNELTMYDEEVL